MKLARDALEIPRIGRAAARIVRMVGGYEQMARIDANLVHA